MKKIEIIGTPFNGIGEYPHRENPPNKLRQLGLITRLIDSGRQVTDLGNLDGFQIQDVRDPETGINDFAMWVNLSKEVSKSITSILSRSSFPLVLGGDCRFLIGIMTALIEHGIDAGLIFIDGHADYHTAETSPTGDPADMELAVLTGRGPESMTRSAGKYPMLNDEDVVVYGIRAWNLIRNSNIDVFDFQRLSKLGIKEAVIAGVSRFTKSNMPVWLHFDVDVLDPKVMPVMYPEKGGLGFDEAYELLNTIMKTCNVEGASIACYHPSLDNDDSAGKNLVDLLVRVFSA